MGEVDVIIVGQGLAGSALAMALLKRGKSLLVVDDAVDSAASRVAVGLVTTLAGKGMNPTWRQEAYLPEAMGYYRGLERQSRMRLFHDIPVLRLFEDQKEVTKWDAKLSAIEAWVAEGVPAVSEKVRGALGGFVMQQSGRLDTRNYLEVVRQILVDQGMYQTACWHQEEVVLRDGMAMWRGVKAKKVILCQGYAGLKEGWFSYLPHRSAKGEMLSLEITDLDPAYILNRGGWLVPIGENKWKAGATYEWDDLSVAPTQRGAQQVRSKIESLTSCAYTIQKHEVGVRPIVQRSQPVIGMHKEFEQLGVFNGLGSKGVMTAPSVAEHFAAYLCGEEGLDPALDVARLF